MKKIEFFQLTSVGDRQINQDAMAHIVSKDYALFIVADGLGGHHAGEKASQFFCEGMVKLAKKYAASIAQEPTEIFSAWITDAIEEMKILFADDHMADEAYTTCAILYLDKNIAMTGHCGDSRIYRMNPEKILWRTQDHSLPQLLFNEGMITEQEIARHPEQNQLTRSINIKKHHRVEVKLHPAMEKDETFVLCSDGFWSQVKQEELLKLADLDSEKEILAKLVRLSVYRASGKSDNVTVFSVRYSKKEAKRLVF